MTGPLEKKRIAVGVGGGIAAYKACDLVRALQRQGAEVCVAMTPAACRFVTPLTLQSLSGHPVLVDDFDGDGHHQFGHLQLARWAHAIVVAPATADLLARMRAGMANDAVTTTLLAFRGPVVLAPAMNTAMWEHEATQANISALRAGSRYLVVGPEHGALADGDVGVGRLAALEAIVAAVERNFVKPSLAGKTVVVTAGPTREALDPVRFLSNPSTGKMGVALALEARARGAKVTLILGPTDAAFNLSGVDVCRVTTAEQMRAAVMPALADVDYVIAAAAVSDFRPVSTAAHKVKKGEADLSLRLERTPDILAEVSQLVRRRARPPVLVGFAAETDSLEREARAKLKRKRLDFVVANLVGRPGSGFAADVNEVVVFGKQGKRLAKWSGSKRAIAAHIWSLVAND